jgi:hypothetical protein
MRIVVREGHIPECVIMVFLMTYAVRGEYGARRRKRNSCEGVLPGVVARAIGGVDGGETIEIVVVCGLRCYGEGSRRPFRRDSAIRDALRIANVVQTKRGVFEKERGDGIAVDIFVLKAMKDWLVSEDRKRLGSIAELLPQ